MKTKSANCKTNTNSNREVVPPGTFHGDAVPPGTFHGDAVPPGTFHGDAVPPGTFHGDAVPPGTFHGDAVPPGTFHGDAVPPGTFHGDAVPPGTFHGDAVPPGTFHGDAVPPGTFHGDAVPPGTFHGDAVPPGTFHSVVSYRTKDARADYKFSFERQSDDTWRAYIESQPSYGILRSTDPTIIHRLSDGSRKYVCWTDPLSSEAEAREVAALWADMTQEYIRTGARF